MSFGWLLFLFILLLVVLFLLTVALLLWRSHRLSYSSLGIAALVPSIALGLYLVMGQPGAYLDYQRTKMAIKEQGAMQVLQQNLADMEKQLTDQPGHDGLRIRLARTHMALGQLAKASQLMSYPSIVENEEVVALRLQLHYYQFGWDTEAEELGNQLAELDEQHPTLLSVTALEAFKQQDYTKAIELWRKLLTLDDIPPEQQQQIGELIKQAQQQL